MNTNTENNSDSNNKKINAKKPSRHFARELMIQSLYQWKINYDSGNKIVLNYEQLKRDLSELPTYRNANLEFLQELCENIFANIDDLLTIIKDNLDRNFHDLSPVEGSVILLSAYELKFCLQTPTLVIINEAIELVKKFGSSEGYKYVNVIVEILAKYIRKDENIIVEKHKHKQTHKHNNNKYKNKE